MLVSAPQLDEGFVARLTRVKAQRGPFCLGLDPTPELLAAWGLPDDRGGLRLFCRRVIEAAAEQVCVIKPQSAFFERLGPAGIEVLAETMDQIRAAGALCLLDVKRGDIGSTSAAYAASYLGAGSPLRADAITLHAYLGFGALQPFVERARESGAGLFVVVLSSNPEGERLQAAQIEPGLSVAEHLADEITRCNRELAPGADLGPIGAVVGLTAKRATEIAARLPHSMLLLPGLGAQGGSFDDVAARFAACKSRVLPSASRSVLARGPGLESLRTAVREHCEQARALLGA